MPGFLKSLLRRLFRLPADQVSDVALEWAASRGVLPTAMSSPQIQETFSRAVRARAVFSARTTSALYLQEVKDSIDLAMQGGYENDLPKLRLELKRTLARLGYTPATGFPGDAALGIPSAEPGSLQDLSSDRRINLILDTQISLARGASQRQRGLEPDRRERYPAWELVRVYRRKTPRGENHTVGWPERWVRAGGPITPGGRLVALKEDPIWRALGDTTEFPDAIDADHPPFAFHSGMRWREIAKDEAESLGLLPATTFRPVSVPAPADVLPDPQYSLKGIDPVLRDALIARTKAKRAAKPDHIRYDELMARELETAREAYAAKPVWSPEFTL